MAGTGRPGPDCWAKRILTQLDDPGDIEIATMYLHGPESAEYTHTDVWRALAAIGKDVEYEAVKKHRTGRCRCRADRRAELAARA